MAFIHFPKRWTRQPPGQERLNRSHWAAPWCEALFNAAEFVGSGTTGICRNLADEKLVSVAGVGGVTKGIAIPGYRIESADHPAGLTMNLPKIQAADAFTIVVHMNNRRPGLSRGVVGVNFFGVAGAGEFKIQWFSDNNWYFDVGDEDERMVVSDTATGDHVWAFTWDGAVNTKRIFRDGVQIGTSTTDLDALSGNPSYKICSGSSPYMFAAFHVALPAHAVAELSREQYGLFMPLQRRIYINTVAGGGGATLRSRLTLLGTGV